MTRRGWWVIGGTFAAALLIAWQRKRLVEAIGVVWRSAYAGNVGGKRTAPVDQVVIHTVYLTGPAAKGTAASAISWFGMDHGSAGPSSAHYIVGRDGTVTQMVQEDTIAWHASDRSVNGRSIGIECEGSAADPATWTPELMAALVQLVAEITREHGVPVERGTWNTPGIIGHADVPYAAAKQGKTDPGPHFPWDDFLRRVRAMQARIA